MVPEEVLKTDHGHQNCRGCWVRQSGGNAADGDSGNPMTEKTSGQIPENTVTKDGRGDRDQPGHSRTLGVIRKGRMSTIPILGLHLPQLPWIEKTLKKAAENQYGEGNPQIQ